jgi:hypothetical protein
MRLFLLFSILVLRLGITDILELSISISFAMFFYFSLCRSLALICIREPKKPWVVKLVLMVACVFVQLRWL